MRADGHYFQNRSAHCVDAQIRLSGRYLFVESRQGTLLAHAPFDGVRATARLARLTRKLYLPDGGCFETHDNDAVDEMLRTGGRPLSAGLVHRLETSWRMVAASIVVAAAVAAFMALIGIPAMAQALARETPPGIARVITDHTLATLDGTVLKPSKLGKARTADLDARVDDIAQFMPSRADGYRLLLRDAPAIGPNAFALPDGRIVMTDQLVTLSKNDDELEGVLAHEISHIVHAHGLQRAYQAAMIPAILAFISGDVSQLGHAAAYLPGILLQSSYSRSFEQQADDDAAAAMRQAGLDPARLADLLTRIEQKYCGEDGCKTTWLGDHPDTNVRAAKLRGN